MRALALFVLAAAVAFVANLFGLWWATFVATLVAGVLARRAVVSLVLGALAGALAWGGGLAEIEWLHHVEPTARAIAGVMGFASAGPAAPIALTVAVGLLLGLAGGWLGGAVGRLLPVSSSNAGAEAPPSPAA